ncbi:MAG: CvpA family protein [Steroidobacteraceae bacterium]|jgi:membrane protein required for colicin V production
MTGADFVILLVLLGSTLIGLLRGFVREAASLAFWIIAIWAAWKFGPLVEPHLGGLLADPSVAPWVGRLVVLMLVLVVGSVAGMLLTYFTRSMGLGPLDRVIGLLFGIVRGVVLVGLMVIGGELLHLNHEEWWNRSKLIPYGETAGDWLRAMVGERGDPWAKLERLTGVKVKAGKTGGP